MTLIASIIAAIAVILVLAGGVRVIRHAQDFIRRLRIMEDECREGRRKRNSLESSLKTLGKERDQLSSELEDLRGKLIASEESVDVLKNQLVDAQRRHEELAKEHAKMQKKHAECLKAKTTSETSSSEGQPTSTSSSTSSSNRSKHSRARAQSAGQAEIAQEIALRTNEIQRNANHTALKLREQLTKKDAKIKGLKAELRAKQNQMRNAKDHYEQLKSNHDAQMRRITEKKEKSDALITELRGRVKNLTKQANGRQHGNLSKKVAGLEKENDSLKDQIKTVEKEHRRRFKNWEAERDVMLEKVRNLKKKLRDVARYPSASTVPAVSSVGEKPTSGVSDLESKHYPSRHYDEQSAITKMILEKFGPATRDSVNLKSRQTPVSFGEVMGKMNAARPLESRMLPVGAVMGSSGIEGEFGGIDDSCNLTIDMKGKPIEEWLPKKESPSERLTTKGPSRPPRPHHPTIGGVYDFGVFDESSRFRPPLTEPTESVADTSVTEFGYTPAIFDDDVRTSGGEWHDGYYDLPWDHYPELGDAYPNDQLPNETPQLVGGKADQVTNGASRSCSPQSVSGTNTKLPSLHSCSSECSDPKNRKRSSSTEFNTPTPPIPEGKSTIKTAADAGNEGEPAVNPWWDSPTKTSTDPRASIWAM